MALLAFWLTNVTQLLYYLKKDTGLVHTTADYQLHLSELVHEIYQLIIRDAQRRIDRILEPAMLEYDPIPGLEDVQYSDEWRLFRKRSQRVSTPPSEHSN